MDKHRWAAPRTSARRVGELVIYCEVRVVRGAIALDGEHANTVGIGDGR